MNLVESTVRPALRRRLALGLAAVALMAPPVLHAQTPTVALPDVTRACRAYQRFCVASINARMPSFCRAMTPR